MRALKLAVLKREMSKEARHALYLINSGRGAARCERPLDYKIRLCAHPQKVPIGFRRGKEKEITFSKYFVFRGGDVLVKLIY